MTAPKKTGLVWGIVLAAIGLSGVSSVNKNAVYVIIWIIFILVGGLLIFLYIQAVRRYNILKQEEFNTRIEGQKLESTRRSVERSVPEREEARIKAETAKIKGGSREVKVCPSCGGATRGDYCEYCGRKL